VRLAVTVLCVQVAVAGLFLVGTAGHALHNGDEAIYAEMAREMRASGDWGTLRWQHEPQFPRPPLSVWLLAAADPSNLRIVQALICGLEVGLVLALGWLWWGPLAGATAAGVLLGSDLFLGYARYFESEPLLCVMVLASFLCWQRRRYLGWGVFLGLALMVKQLVGALPLLALVVDRPPSPSAPSRRDLALGLVAALVVWAPWHIYAALQHGFLYAYFVENVVARSAAPMLHVTRWSFYFRELWRSEGPFALLFGVSVLWILGQWQIGRPKLSERLVAIWGIGVVVLFTLARSRYDYYLLLGYPAFALASGALVSRLGRMRHFVAPPLVVTMLALHLPRNLDFRGEDEQRALVQVANERHPLRLYLYNTHAYAARFYSDVDVTTLLESDADVRAARELQRSGMPSSVLPAPDLPASLASLPRPFVLMMPRARAYLIPAEREASGGSRGASLLREGLTPLADTQRWILLEAR
jgi:4-amino-4-deoxy-L-arabinose transferase-like glycosyltransferase